MAFNIDLTLQQIFHVSQHTLDTSMNDIPLNLLQMGIILIVIAFLIIIPNVLKLLNFIKLLKDKKELNPIIGNEVAKVKVEAKNTNIVVLICEAILFIIVLYVYEWNVLNLVKHPMVIIYLLIPLLNLFIVNVFYYMRIRYLNQSLKIT